MKISARVMTCWLAFFLTTIETIGTIGTIFYMREKKVAPWKGILD